MTPWLRHLPTGEVGRVLDEAELWGSRVFQLYLPASNVVVRAVESQVEALAAGDPVIAAWRAIAAAAGGRILDVLAQPGVLASPVEGTVTPLPHQLDALARAMSGRRIRYLFADEVGLGKTIEAGLVIRELKLRGRAKRILVVAPMGLCSQWVQEMATHFRETFTLVEPGQLAAIRRSGGAQADENLWTRFDQAVVSVDSLKPVESRRGWSRDRVDAHNRERFEDVVTAGWDLIVIDEAHRLAGSSADVARYKLGEGLARAAPYLLLLSATPHQGKTDAFRRLMGLLDADLFVDDSTITQARVAPFVVRTEKRRAVDADGNALFVPRCTQLRAVPWHDRTEQRALYDEVTTYVREGYDLARREKRAAVGFLMLLFQRMVTSSTRAIRFALERRLDALSEPPAATTLFVSEPPAAWARPDEFEDNEEAGLDALAGARLAGRYDERGAVERLLSLARRCEVAGPDAKAQELVDLLTALEAEERDPQLKLLVFTEFVPTQEMLARFLTDRGCSVVTLNGSLDMTERRAVQQAFRDEARVLVSTDAGGEGLNLQFAHVVVNYDLPWNPMKVEQRIGRVDRIGQKLPVRAFNFALEDSVELRVREVLEEKLARILEEFGVDKLSDVLDSDELDVDFDKVFVDGLMRPDAAAASAAAFAEELRRKAKEARAGTTVLGPGATPDPAAARAIEDHQLPVWTERFVAASIAAAADRGARLDRDGAGWSLRWPDGQRTGPVVFDRKTADDLAVPLLTVEEPHVQRLLARLGPVVPGELVPSLVLPGVSDRVSGLWSLWRVTLSASKTTSSRYFPLFVNDAGLPLLPTARLAWDRLISASPAVGRVGVALGEADLDRLYTLAVSATHDTFEGLRSAHEEDRRRERAKTDYGFSSRRRMIERLGLQAVREFRIRQLDDERRRWEAEHAATGEVVPELTAVAIVRILPVEAR